MIQSAPNTKPRVIAIIGPTATGKTDLSVHIAQRLQTEIISADSQILYRELDIGTAKPTLAERQEVPHHMIDVAAPDEVFSAANFQTQATLHLQDIQRQGHIPVVVGGTGFYLRALLESDFIPAVPPNEAFRAEMHQLADQQGSTVLHDRLRMLDPVRAEALHPNDRVRIIRALEIIDATGLPVPNQPTEKALDVLWLGLTYEDRDLLRHRIDQRIALMMAQGWLAEVERLVGQYGPTAHALGVAHGYPELVEVILGQRSLNDALAQIRINIHQYARRQMTWFKRNPDIQWSVRDEQSPEALRHWADQTVAHWLNGPH
jgi:tRNA dimethylallyltransferase